MPPLEQLLPLPNSDSSIHGFNLNLLALDNAPSAIKKSTVSEAYSKVNLDSALDLLKKPAEFDDLYKTQRQYIDANGDGRIDKTEIIAALDDPSASLKTKQLANALLADYDRLSELNQESEISELVPAGLKEFITGHDSKSKPGIGEEQIKAFKISGDPSFRSAEENSKAWKYFGMAAAGVGTVFMLKQLPELFMASLLARSSIVSGLQELGGIALLGALPSAIGSGGVAYGASRLSDYLQHNKEHAKANDLLTDLSHQREVINHRWVGTGS